MKRIALEVETQELCHYGCGQQAKYRNGSNNLMCDISSSKCPAVKLKNSSGVQSVYDSGQIDAKQRYRKSSEETKFSQASGNRGKRFAIFGNPGSGDFKNSLITERGHQCESCKLTTWLSQSITLELEHTDGRRQNNTKENLKLLCPNCHSQTITWRGRNIQRIKTVSDETLIESLRNQGSIRAALILVGMTPKGANYARCHELISNHKIDMGS